MDYEVVWQHADFPASTKFGEFFDRLTINYSC